jgi:hypothetical protein
VLKKDEKGGITRYFLHYQGWSKKWDEWVDGRRMMDYTEENLKAQKEHNAKKRHSASDASSKLKDRAIKAKEGKGKKRKVDSTRELVSVLFKTPYSAPDWPLTGIHYRRTTTQIWNRSNSRCRSY